MPNENSYFEGLGFTRDPFSDGEQDVVYFTTEELTHRIDLIKHLLEFSQQVIVVTAAQGSGKTSMKT